MGGAAQVAMRVASQIWQVVFASQTLQVFCLALCKKAQYVVVYANGNGATKTLLTLLFHAYMCTKKIKIKRRFRKRR
jgi:hypothetical protein